MGSWIKPRIEELEDAAWCACEEPDEHVYALLDGAADPRLVERLRSYGLKALCLYEAKAPRALKLAAPHLVRLDPEHEFALWLLREGWGRAWGLWFSSEAGLPKLRRHFRRLLEVEREGGGRLYFRFYDPRILPVYLRTCRSEELSAVFGPVLRFFSEWEPGGAWVQSRLVEGRLRQDALGRAPSDPPADELPRVFSRLFASEGDTRELWTAAGGGRDAIPEGVAAPACWEELWIGAEEQPRLRQRLLEGALAVHPELPPLAEALAALAEVDRAPGA